MLSQELKECIRYTLILTKKSLYKTIEFQLLFKFFYVSVLFFSLNLIINNIFDTTDIIITNLHLNKTLQSIPIISIFEFKTIFTLLASLFIVAYIYLIEKNGVVIITSNYYLNNFSSSFKALLLAIWKTPLFILRRILEMRLFISIFLILYIIWKLLALFITPHWIETGFAIALVIYGASIFFAILLRYTFNAHITCLDTTESLTKFNESLPSHFIHKRIIITIIFYIFFIIILLLWILIFYATIKLLIHLLTINPNFISTIIAFFLSFTIVSLIVFFSFFKTLKVSLMTTLYYKERLRQHKPIAIQTKTNQPLLSKNLFLAILTIFIISLIAGAILTTTLQPKIKYIINNTQTYNEQIIDIQSMQNINIDDITLQNIIKRTTTKRTGLVARIEQIILFIFSYIVQ